MDDAIALLAGWMELEAGRLSEDDLAVLSDVGAQVYWHGPAKRGPVA